MTITSATSSFRAPPPQRPDAARVQKDNADVGRAQRAQDNTAQQKAVAALRRDDRPPQSERAERSEGDNDRDDRRVQAQAAQRQQAQERSKVGTALDTKA